MFVEGVLRQRRLSLHRIHHPIPALVRNERTRRDPCIPAFPQSDKSYFVGRDSMRQYLVMGLNRKLMETACEFFFTFQELTRLVRKRTHSVREFIRVHRPVLDL
jgi:hypothetical protein